MKKITALEVQKRNPQRVNVYLDDQFAFGLANIVAAWLKVGQEISDGKIAALQEEDAREVAMQQALVFLGYRPRSSSEVRKNLQKHKFSESVIENVLERLQHNGLVNDTDFARAWVENRNTFRPRSRRALQFELRQKGMPEELIHDVLEENVDEGQLAQQAAQKYAQKLQNLEWLEFRTKLGGFLGRRGFSYEVIVQVVRQVWEETHPTST